MKKSLKINFQTLQIGAESTPITLLSVIIKQKIEKVLDIEGEKGNDLQSRAEHLFFSDDGESIIKDKNRSISCVIA